MKTFKLNFKSILPSLIGAAAIVVSMFAQTAAHAQVPLQLSVKIDGIGSLVDPRNGGNCNSIGQYGCSRDTVYLYGDGVSYSTGIFQAVRDPGFCTGVTITGLPAGGVAIMVKGWNERFPNDIAGFQNSATYLVDGGSSASVPLVANNLWSNIAVIPLAVQPSNSRITINASCNTSSFASNVELLEPSEYGRFSLIDAAAAGSVWTGNGSLITASRHTANSETSGGFGRRTDVVRMYGEGQYSAQYFQVYNDGSCNNIRISSSSSAAAYAVKRKEWSARNWTDVVSPGTNFPMIISTGSAGSYYVFQVQSYDLTNRSAQITATCL